MNHLRDDDLLSIVGFKSTNGNLACSSRASLPGWLPVVLDWQGGISGSSRYALVF